MAFTCPRCNAVSHHPLDEDFGYCAKCREFVDTMVRAVASSVYNINKAALARGTLPMWTVYDHPKDHDGYIARCFETGGGNPDPVPTAYTVTGQLNLIREAMARCGLYRMVRSDGDDAKIMETWM
jgi:hypothetical protein